jgi:hypothetical protein
LLFFQKIHFFGKIDFPIVRQGVQKPKEKCNGFSLHLKSLYLLCEKNVKRVLSAATLRRGGFSRRFQSHSSPVA